MIRIEFSLGVFSPLSHVPYRISVFSTTHWLLAEFPVLPSETIADIGVLVAAAVVFLPCLVALFLDMASNVTMMTKFRIMHTQAIHSRGNFQPD